MTGIHLEINEDKELERIQKALACTPEKARLVLKKAVNDTAKKAAKELAKEAKNDYRITTVKFAKEFQQKKATKANLTAAVFATGSPIPSSKFKVNPTSPAYSEKGNGPVKLAILRKNAPKNVESKRDGMKAFLTKYASGHAAVVQRQTGESYTAAGWKARENKDTNVRYKRRTGKLDSTRIREFYGPSVAQVLEQVGLKELFAKEGKEIRKKMRGYLDDAIMKHIRTELHFMGKE